MKKYMILGVSFGWGVRKGLDIFIQLAEMLGEEYQIVLVGTDAQVDEQLPANIISIHRTQDQQELAQIYSAADVFVNPTREDNYPTVNMEALACGTPVITFMTGGSPESLHENCGKIIAYEDLTGLKQAIEDQCRQGKPIRRCLQIASKFHDESTKFAEYVQLYERINQS